MEIYLTRGNEQRKVKPGAALYLLLGFIPMVGGIVQLIFAIINKQFKGVILNSFLVALGSLIVLIVIAIISGLLGDIGIITMLLGGIALVVFVIYSFVILVLNSNRYSLKQYLEDGYTIEREEDLPENVKFWIKESKEKEKPFFLLLKF